MEVARRAAHPIATETPPLTLVRLFIGTPMEDRRNGARARRLRKTPFPAVTGRATLSHVALSNRAARPLSGGCMRTLVLFLGALTIPVSSRAQSAERPEILVLGTYHMASPGHDIHNMQADDVQSPKRQQEM